MKRTTHMGGMTFYGRRVAPEVTAIEATNTDLYVGYSSGDVIKFEATFPGANDRNNDCKASPDAHCIQGSQPMHDIRPPEWRAVPCVFLACTIVQF